MVPESEKTLNRGEKMNTKIQKMIETNVEKIMSEYNKRFTTYKITVKAVKDGEMQDGEIFCYKGETYQAEFSFEPGNPEEDWYDVKDATWLNENGTKYRCPHGMDAEFFNEYFIVMNKRRKVC